ncbi:hypothetical protein [Novosphingobium sp.]|uniref:hypothetical protein n=1 Tax=Novosphingobium sp. TaxID=1874826 RepID=UPI00286E5A49|nr:hypothetical protein [Novosphingobium sp.]
MADVVVVCHNNVIIFSDKKVKFDFEIDLSISWQRWYNRAILHSVSQLKKANGWIYKFRNKIFTDAACRNPIDLFERVSDDITIHLICVANGASGACIRHFNGGSGSLVIDPEQNVNNPNPFHVGNPGGIQNFVHVLDEANLNVILQELDTIGDFVDYLNARRRVIDGGNLFYAASEEDLLAVYLKDVNEYGAHDFVKSTGVRFESNEKFAIQEGTYLNYVNNSAYKRKKRADKVSYLWDKLIETFAGHLTAGTLAPVPNELSSFDGRNGGAEIGLRFMALQSRVLRRAHSQAILGAFDTLGKSRADRFFRAILPPNEQDGDTAFFILLLKKNGRLAGLSFDEYRSFRAMCSHAYSQALLERYRNIKRVVGIATEGDFGGGRSEDLIYQEPPEWTDDAINETRILADKFEVFNSATPRNYSAKEYPDTDLGIRGKHQPVPYKFYAATEDHSPEVRGRNRSETRALRAKARRKN